MRSSLGKNENMDIDVQGYIQESSATFMFSINILTFLSLVEVFCQLIIHTSPSFIS